MSMLFYLIDKCIECQLNVIDEDRDMWRIYAEREDFSAALTLCRDPLQRELVFAAQVSMHIYPRGFSPSLSIFFR